jgi:hypothetical protein
MRRFVVLALLLSACAGTVQPGASSSPLPATLGNDGSIASPTALPTATPDPEAVRKAAGIIYATAAAKYGKDIRALNSKYKTFTSLKNARAFYAAATKIEGTFLTTVKKLVVPADTAADLHSLVAKSAALQALEVEGSTVKTWAAVDSVQRASQSADRAASAAANLVRADLGLPPVS